MSSLAAALAERLGAAHVSTDPEICALAGSDLFEWPDAVPAEIVIRPGSTAETGIAMRLLAEFGRAVVPRGAGMSYSAGVVPKGPAVVVDTTRLDCIQIDAANLTAVVGAGTTWQALATALVPHRLRAAQASPVSGSVSTVGGVAAQNLPGTMDGILGLAVVLADGSIARTGALTLHHAPPFWRHMGPDLTGMFLGDCGAFGVKTEVALRLAPEAEAAHGSFAFGSGGAMMTALVEIAQSVPVARAFAMDPARVRGAADPAGTAVRERSRPAAAPWTLHLTAEGLTEAVAEVGIEAARRIAAASGGQAVAATIPRALRARPYSIRGLVGPAGERWVPVHGMLPLATARDCLAALEAAHAAMGADMAEHGIAVSHMVSSAGAYVSIEPMFYWRDALDPLHLQHLSESSRARFCSFAPNLPARALVRRAREVLFGVMDAHGAVHAQIGRFYPLASRMDPGAAALLVRVKSMLDPRGRMNPGVLEGSQG